MPELEGLELDKTDQVAAPKFWRFQKDEARSDLSFRTVIVETVQGRGWRWAGSDDP